MKENEYEKMRALAQRELKEAVTLEQINRLPIDLKIKLLFRVLHEEDLMRAKVTGWYISAVT